MKAIYTDRIPPRCRRALAAFARNSGADGCLVVDERGLPVLHHSVKSPHDVPELEARSAHTAGWAEQLRELLDSPEDGEPERVIVTYATREVTLEYQAPFVIVSTRQLPSDDRRKSPGHRLVETLKGELL